MTSTVNVPNFKWAQDKSFIFMTIELLDVKDNAIKCNVTRDEFSFSYVYNNHKKYSNKTFELKFKFRFGINPKTVKYHAARYVTFKLEKESDEGWWPHIISKEDKPRLKNRVGIDWNLWREEDESDVEDNNQYQNLGGRGGMPPMGGMGGMPGMGGMGGMPGMGGMGGMGGGMPGMGGMGGMGGMQGMQDLLKRMKPNTDNKSTEDGNDKPDSDDEPIDGIENNDDKIYEDEPPKLENELQPQPPKDDDCGCGHDHDHVHEHPKTNTESDNKSEETQNNEEDDMMNVE